MEPHCIWQGYEQPRVEWATGREPGDITLAVASINGCYPVAVPSGCDLELRYDTGTYTVWLVEKGTMLPQLVTAKANQTRHTDAGCDCDGCRWMYAHLDTPEPPS